MIHKAFGVAALMILVLGLGAQAQPLDPSDLVYEGVIAPPFFGGSGPRFGYGMYGLEYDPTCAGSGDPSPSDGYPGCLVGTSNKTYDMVAMFDIPAPRTVAIGDYNSVPKGSLVVDFFKCSIRADGTDIQEELDLEPAWNARDIPGVARSEAGEWVCMCGHDWYDVMLTDYDSHCWFDFDPGFTNAQGAYNGGPPDDLETNSQRTSWYLGSIPQAWADAHLSARGKSYCFSGMQRMGGGCKTCSAGPTIYAFPCARPSDAAPGPLSMHQLLGYPRVRPIQVFGKLHPDYSPRSQARGVSWVRESVLVSARKGGDYWWYGKPDPWTDPHSHRNVCLFNESDPPDVCFLDYGPDLPAGTRDKCDSSKGFHALMDPDGSGGPQYTATLQFYDAAEIARVAEGTRAPDTVLPYASIEAPEELWSKNCTDVGDLAYDPASQKLYWVELRAERPVLHVYSVGNASSATLSVNKSGAGSGVVTSSPSGIDCGLDCSEVYDLGTVVSLSAVPDEGSIFAGWTGNEDCTDGRLTANRALSCTATFDLEGGVRLKVSKVGTGTVTSSPAGIDCGVDCSEDYAPGSRVTLTAKAGGDSAFAGWSGDADCTDGVVTMNFATSCTATFSGSGLRRLSVEKVGLGTGTVQSSPSGIACGADCEEDFATGTQVILRAKPAARAVLLGFKGDPDCSDAEVTMDAAKTCVGEFALGAALEVKKTGDGTGKVVSDPAGIDCGSDCREVYLLLAKVKLTPTPDVGSRFAGWKGAPDCRDGVVALRSDLGCTAVFSPSEIRPRVAKLSIRKSGFGDGIVKSTPFGIECGTSCNHFFAVRTRVKLRPTPMPGSFFVGWKGHFDCLDGVVALRTDRMCTAEFGSSKGARPARR